MRRRTQIVLAITFMVAALVAGASYIYTSHMLRQRVVTTHDTAMYLTSQLAYLASNAAPDLTSTRVDTNSPDAVRRGVAYYLGTDRDLNTMLDSVVGSWPTIYDAMILDVDGKAILHTDPNLVGKKVTDRPDFATLENAGFRRQLQMIYRPPAVYEVRMPLLLNGSVFGDIRVGVSTVFLQNELTPQLRRAVELSTVAILCSLLLAALLSHIALGPLEHISRSLDNMAEAHGGGTRPVEGESDEYGQVTEKIANLGRQMRDAREIFSALKNNVDQIMSSLQDGLMLFTRDSKVVLVSASVERFLGRSRRELLGHNVKEIFSAESPLGALVLDAFSLHHSIEERELESTNGRRVTVSLDFIHEKGTQIGALLTMRDAESARRIEDEIELSRRISASGRVTRGVAHEVKNPINAIVLHLQLLRNKMQVDPDAGRHVDIIDSEIHRLDRVVQILVDFTRPRELHMEDADLRLVLDEVVLLASPDAAQHGVKVVRQLPAEAIPVKIDVDLIKQAVLNVVLNGVQAMPNGGALTIRVHVEDDVVITEVADEGGGIPAAVQHKVFELYFTTKKSGTGIGLAQTYQIMQWHYGAVDFESQEGKGTTFRLRLPLAETRPPAAEDLASTGELIRKS